MSNPNLLAHAKILGLELLAATESFLVPRIDGKLAVQVEDVHSPVSLLDLQIPVGEKFLDDTPISIDIQGESIEVLALIDEDSSLGESAHRRRQEPPYVLSSERLLRLPRLRRPSCPLNSALATLPRAVAAITGFGRTYEAADGSET